MRTNRISDFCDGFAYAPQQIYSRRTAQLGCEFDVVQTSLEPGLDKDSVIAWFDLCSAVFRCCSAVYTGDVSPVWHRLQSCDNLHHPVTTVARWMRTSVPSASNGCSMLRSYSSVFLRWKTPTVISATIGPNSGDGDGAATLLLNSAKYQRIGWYHGTNSGEYY